MYHHFFFFFFLLSIHSSAFCNLISHHWLEPPPNWFMREPSPTCQMPYLYSVEAVITIDYFHSPESVFSLDCCKSAFLVLIPSQTLETSFPNSPPEMLVFPRIPSLAHFSSISLFSLHNHIHAHLPLLKPKLISSSEVSQVLYPQLALGHFF